MEIPADNQMKKKTQRIINKSMLQGVAAQLNVAGGALKSVVTKNNNGNNKNIRADPSAPCSH